MFKTWCNCEASSLGLTCDSHYIHLVFFLAKQQDRYFLSLISDKTAGSEFIRASWSHVKTNRMNVRRIFMQWKIIAIS